MRYEVQLTRMKPPFYTSDSRGAVRQKAVTIENLGK